MERKTVLALSRYWKADPARRYHQTFKIHNQTLGYLVVVKLAGIGFSTPWQARESITRDII